MGAARCAGLLALAASLTLGTGAPARSVRIGALTTSWGPTTQIVGLRDGLIALGYRDNQDFAIGVRFTQGDTAALPTAARELVEQGVDLLFVEGDEGTRVAMAATSRIPIVFAGGGDPVGRGFVQSITRPAGNVTGVTNQDIELSTKRMELFREMVPGLRRVLYVRDPASDYSAAELTRYREAAQRLGLVLVERAVRTPEEARTALAPARRREADGVMAPYSLSLNIPSLVVEATAKSSLPTMFGDVFFVEQGGLASYGPDLYATGRLAARLVDKILKGETPATIPVEDNSTIRFVVNRKVARALGLELSQAIIYRADRVLE